MELQFNPDVMEVSDLDKAEDVFRLLANYCHLKTQAIVCRKRGFVASALIYEKECDGIYKDLPVEYKW
jgi:hypothetical protein